MNTERKPINATERLAFFETAVCLDMLDEARKGLQSRKGLIPKLNFHLGAAISALEKVVAGFCETVPDDQLLSIQKNVKRFEVKYGVKLPPQRRDEMGFWLSEKDLQTMSGALYEHCLGCMKDVTEQRACGLKKVLDRVSAPEHAHGCDWAEMLREIRDDE